MQLKNFHRPKVPTAFTITCHGWDIDSQADTLLPYISLGIWLPSPSGASHLVKHNCHSPEELWNLLQSFTTDPAAVIKDTYNFKGAIPQVKKSTSLPTNLNDLF